MLYLKNKNAVWKNIIVIPVISFLVIPIAILDVCVEFYHRICFPLCKLAYIKRKTHIKIIDRGRLPYLTFWQKLYCMYCGYANGAIRYWMEIASITEKYWCGIKHEKDSEFVNPKEQEDFAEYGNQEEFIKKYKNQEAVQ
ncbi:MAG: hypothetical protein WCV80_00595 [Candidatus Paceibacterota bacterium]|jgi:hypothetical protein